MLLKELKMYNRVGQERRERAQRGVSWGAQPYIPGRKYSYVCGFTKAKGKKVLWGPMGSDEAIRALSELNEGEVFELTTKDPHRATREIRDILIKRGEAPDEALKKLLHKHEVEPEPTPGLLSKLFKGRPSHDRLSGITRATPPPRSILRHPDFE